MKGTTIEVEIVHLPDHNTRLPNHQLGPRIVQLQANQSLASSAGTRTPYKAPFTVAGCLITTFKSAASVFQTVVNQAKAINKALQVADHGSKHPVTGVMIINTRLSVVIRSLSGKTTKWTIVPSYTAFPTPYVKNQPSSVCMSHIGENTTPDEVSHSTRKHASPPTLSHHQLTPPRPVCPLGRSLGGGGRKPRTTDHIGSTYVQRSRALALKER